MLFIRIDTPMNEYISVLKKYTVFDGRASRKEFWMFVLVNLIVVSLFIMLGSALGLETDKNGNVLSRIYQVAVLLPTIGVAIRRMHDVNKSGWFMLIPIYNLILELTPGVKGDNKYGPEPTKTTVLPQ